MNRPSSECKQASLICRVAREMSLRTIDQQTLSPGALAEKSHRLRKEGDSNPRYGNPYGSLANCWFQPNRGVISLIAGAKVRLFFEPCKFFGYFFHLPLHFSIKSEFRSLEHDAFQLRNSPIKTLSSRHHLKIVQYVTWETWYIWSY